MRAELLWAGLSALSFVACASEEPRQIAPLVLTELDLVGFLPDGSGPGGLVQHLSEACAMLRSKSISGDDLLVGWRPTAEELRLHLPSLDADALLRAYDRRAGSVAAGLARALSYRPGLEPMVRDLAESGGPLRPGQRLPLIEAAAFATSWHDGGEEVVAEPDDVWVHIGGRWRLLLGASDVLTAAR